MSTARFQKVPLFSGLSEKEISGLVGTAKEREFAEGEQIIKQGDEGGQGFYLLMEGSARVSKGDTTLAELGPGDYFGEMSLLLDETPRTADVVATSPIRALVVTQWDFRAFLKTHEDVSAKLMAELARRLVATDATLSN